MALAEGLGVEQRIVNVETQDSCGDDRYSEENRNRPRPAPKLAGFELSEIDWVPRSSLKRAMTHARLVAQLILLAVLIPASLCAQSTGSQPQSSVDRLEACTVRILDQRHAARWYS